MDYEKMYKAVLKTATQWIKDGCSDKEKICLESVFPQLRESEDERIRKEIIDFIQWAEDRGMTRHDYHQAKRPAIWIAYLEKHKETLHISETCKENANSFTDGVIEVRSFQRGMEEGRRLEKKKLDKMIVVSPEVWDNAISDAFENGKKEGEKQKELPFVKDVVLGYPGLYFYDGERMHFRGSPAMEEKQKENPKSADSISSDCASDAKCEDRWHKVEDSLPDNGRLVLANDCLGNRLLARYDGEGNWEVSVYDNNDYYCRNTITKWCEIPSEKQKPIEYLSKDKVYAIMNKLTELSTSDLIPLESEEYVKIQEITSDVRGLLDYPIDQKPVDYEAELKKCQDNPLYFYDKYVFIKYKPAEWSEEDNIGWDEAFACVTKIEKAAKDEEELQNAVTAEKWLKEIKFKHYVHPVKQGWSEEEKDKLNSIERLIVNANAHGNYLIGDKEAIDLQHFIRSIVKPTTNLVEWSEEDEAMFQESLTDIIYAKNDLNKKGCEGLAKSALNAFNWLNMKFKSLRPSWKPSEAQLMALHSVIDDESDTIGNEQLKLLYEHLKKL